MASFASQPTACDAAITRDSFRKIVLVAIKGNGPTSQMAPAEEERCGKRVKVQPRARQREEEAA